MAHKVLLPTNIVILIFGITMFMVYQTIPILVRSPQPLGFGGDAVSTAMVQLPFMIVILVFAPSSGFIVSKIGNLKPTVRNYHYDHWLLQPLSISFNRNYGCNKLSDGKLLEFH